MNPHNDMAHTTYSIALGLCLSLLVRHTALSQQPTAKEQMAAEINRLKQTLSALKLPANEARPYVNEFKYADAALQSGYLYSSLSRLQMLRVNLMAYEYRNAKSGIEKQGQEAFEAEWRKLGEELAAKEQQLKTTSAAGIPAAVRAIAETSLSQVRPYYQSGKLYALNAGFNAGLYYLGRAPAHLDFAFFSWQLHLAQPLLPLKLRSLEPELKELEAEILAAHQRAEQADLSAYVLVHTTLKLALDLNREGRYYGALQKYLETCLNLGMVLAPLPEPAQVTASKKQSETFRVRLSAGKTDHSIGLIYWEMAQAVWQTPIETASQNDLLRTAVIIEQVLPRYFKIIAKAQPR